MTHCRSEWKHKSRKRLLLLSRWRWNWQETIQNARDVRVALFNLCLRHRRFWFLKLTLSWGLDVREMPEIQRNTLVYNHGFKDLFLRCGVSSSSQIGELHKHTQQTKPRWPHNKLRKKNCKMLQLFENEIAVIAWTLLVVSSWLRLNHVITEGIGEVGKSYRTLVRSQVS